MLDASRMVMAIGPVAVAEVGVVATPDHVGFVALLAAVVGVVAVMIAWIDRRIERKMSDHAKADAERERLKSELDHERHQSLLRELGQLRESVSIRGEIRALRLQLAPALTPLPPRED
jgi:hypothetical protein